MSLQKVTPSDQQLSAEDWNIFIDVAKKVLSLNKNTFSQNLQQLKNYNTIDCISSQDFKNGDAVFYKSNKTMGLHNEATLISAQNGYFVAQTPDMYSSMDTIGVCICDTNQYKETSPFKVQISGLAVVYAEGQYLEGKHLYMRIQDGKFKPSYYGRSKIIKKLQFDKIYYLIDLNCDFQQQKKYLVRIDGNTVITTDRKWQYFYTVMKNITTQHTPQLSASQDSSSDMPNAINLLQVMNTTGDTLQGNGADFGSQPLISNSSVKMYPAPPGTFVELTIGKDLCYFSFNNQIYGVCGNQDTGA